MIHTSSDARLVPPYMAHSMSKRRDKAKEARLAASIWKLKWNPYSQRLVCPYCERTYIAGLVLYPVKWGMWRITKAPPDTLPSKRQWAEIRRAAGGWFAQKELAAGRAGGEPVNLAVDQPCSCPDIGLPVPECPVHGMASQTWGEEAKVPPKPEEI
jgi:hypothetical protein